MKSDEVKNILGTSPRNFFGWGTGIRTPVMTESESVALPLGDAPIFSTLHIIADLAGFVNRFCKKVLQKFSALLFMVIGYPVFGGFMSPFGEKILKKF